MQDYETDRLKAQYLDFHYGDKTYFGVENYPKVCAQLCLQACKENHIPLNKALDLGCSVGRSTFELAMGGFNEVCGVDLSMNFVKTANEFKDKKVLKYVTPTEGSLVERNEVSIEALGLESVRDRVRFEQGNAGKLDFEKFNSYDLVFGGNLLCRMDYPKDFLRNVHHLLNIGGLFILTSPCTWLEEYTEKSEWVGGYEENSREVTTYEGMKEILKENFVEVKDPHEVEFVIRETKRKFQHSFAQATYWMKENNTDKHYA